MKRLIKGDEKIIEKQIMAVIRKMGGWVLKVQSGVMIKKYITKDGEEREYAIRLAPPGSHDLVACYRGKFISIEVKSGPMEIRKWKKQTTQRHKDQKRVADEIIKAGGISLLTDSAQDVADFLSSLN